MDTDGIRVIISGNSSVLHLLLWLIVKDKSFESIHHSICRRAWDVPDTSVDGFVAQLVDALECDTHWCQRRYSVEQDRGTAE